MRYTCADSRSPGLQILIHHIYEFKKGVRNMVLHTMEHAELDAAEFILRQKGLHYHVEVVNPCKVNLYFGNPNCVEVIQSFGRKSLSEYTPEEDFILGIMLGYDRHQQCIRYINKIQREQDTAHALLPSEKVSEVA